MNSGVKIKGVQETIIKLNNLTLLGQHKIMGSVIYQSSKPMEDEQKKELLSKTTVRTGNLLRSIGRKRINIKKAKEIGTVHIGPRTGGGFKGYHGHLLEFGHKKRGGKGMVKPYPFVEPAYHNKIDEVRSNMFNKLNNVIKNWVKTGRITVNESFS